MFVNALQGVRVVDLTNNVAGPFATMILADLGAEVIKIEKPDGGDDTRTWGPPFIDGLSASFLSLNRNKKSIALDLKDERGIEALRRLVATADVLVENLRSGAVRRLGMDYDSVRAIKPNIVYCEMGGFGGTGPVSEQPAYDAMMQAHGGLMSLTGEDGRPPVRIPVSILDQGTGMWAANGVLAALRARDLTGEGQHVQVSLLHTAVMWMPSQLLSYLASGELPKRHGSGLSSIVPYQAFEGSDGHLIIAASNDRLFARLCATLGLPEVALDPRFSTNPARVANREAVLRILQDELRKHTVAELVALLGSKGLPVSPVRTLADIVEDEHIADSNMLATTDTSSAGRYVTLPVQFGGSASPVVRGAPDIGEHTNEVLAQLDYSQAEIDALSGTPQPEEVR